MNNLFTIIIPAHNRPERLKRLLDYYVSFNCRVIVSDSSDIAFKYIESYKEKVIYVHYPKMHLAEKLSMIFDKISYVKYIKTAFALRKLNSDVIVSTRTVHNFLVSLYPSLSSLSFKKIK